MSSPYRRSTTTPNTGDRFDSFDIHAERFVPIIENHIRDRYGEPDQLWLAAVEKARTQEMNKDPLRPDHPDRPAEYATYEYFKEAVLRPSLKGIGSRGKSWKKRDRDEPVDPSTRSAAFVQSKLLMGWYGLNQAEIVGTSEPSQFSRDQYTRWPYYSAALALVIERARSTPHEVHVLPDAPDDRREDLQHDPLVYAVPRPGREGREGSDAAHRESAADGQELAGAAHPPRRSPGGRKRRWSSASSRTSGSSSGSGAGAAKPRKP